MTGSPCGFNLRFIFHLICMAVSRFFFHGFLLHLSSSVMDLFKSFAHFSNCAVCVDINPVW